MCSRSLSKLSANATRRSVDGAIAAAVVLTVVYPDKRALGRDLFAVLRRPDGEALVVNASGPAPAGVDVARLRAAGRMPVFGVDAVTVPRDNVIDIDAEIR